jgi:thioredoxin-dependent peroxiredoxin
MLQAGQHAPIFTLPDADMQTVDVGRYRGKKHIVLYFYPRDGTPGCTIQATEFSDHEDEFARYDCVVLGVSPDDCMAHAQFRDTNGVSIQLLADTEGEVCRKYGVLEEKEANGQFRRSITRSTFVIDKKGLVRHAFYNVNPRGHAHEVLSLVKSLG